MASAKKVSRKQAGVADIDRWMLWIYLALVILVPLAFSRSPLEFFMPSFRGFTFDQFDIVKILTLRILTLIALVLWAVKLFRAPEGKVRLTKLDFAVLAFLLLATISTLLSVHPYTSIHGKYKRFEGLLTYINYAMLYFLALQTFYSDRRLKLLAQTMAITGGLVALYGVSQFAGFDIFQWAQLPFEQRRSFSTFGNPDLLAGYLVLALPFSIAAFLAAKITRDVILYGATTAIITINIMTSLVRGAWIATAVVFLVILVYVFLGYRDKRINRTQIARVGGILATLLAVCVAVTIFSGTINEPNLNVIERVKSMTKINEGSAGNRLEIWKSGIQMIRDRPIFGFGPDTYRLASEHYETEKYVIMGRGKTVSDNAHNYLIQLASGPGTLALIAFLVLVFGVVIAAGRTLLHYSDERLLMGLALFAAVVGYFVHLLFGVSVSGSTSMFWVALGALVGMTSLAKVKSLSVNDTVNKTIIAVVMLIAAVSTIYATRMFVGDYFYAKAYSAPASTPSEIIEADYKRAIALYENGRYYDSLGQFYHDIYSTLRNQEELVKGLDAYKTAIEFEPLEADHKVFLANAYLAMQPPNLDEARLVLLETLSYRPRSVPSHFMLGDVYRFKGDYDKATSHFNESLKYDPNSKYALMGLAQIDEVKGRKLEALEKYRRVVAIEPQDQRAVEAIKRLQ